MKSLLLLLALLSILAGCSQNEKATLVLHNATVWTADKTNSWAQAIAVKGDSIIAVGKNEDVELLIGNNTKVIDAEGKLVLPGFIDSHLHFIEGGFRLSSVQLRDASTKAEFINRIAEFAKSVKPGTWIIGGDWDHENWGGDLPLKEWIDSVTTEHPVWVNRLDGHMALANSLALKLAGVDKSTPQVEGGTIVKNGTGDPSGILKDNAMYYIDKAVPPPSDELNDKALQAAMDYVSSLGITSVHHMGSWSDLEIFERAKRNNNLHTRIYAAVPLSSWDKLKVKLSLEGNGDEWLRIGGLKGFVDGSLGSHTALFFEPYSDKPGDTGLLVNSKDDLFNWISNADKEGMHIIVHAIGDSAISLLLDIYERVESENGLKDRRFRIEHSQHIAQKDFKRFRDMQIIASMQPYHAIDDGRWAEKLIGPERIKTTYAFRTLLDHDVIIAFGSDWYVAPPSPIEGIYAAVTRRTLDGKNPNGWVPEQKISIEEALKAYTINGAYASFEERIKGSIERGKLADMVILQENIFEIPPEKINEVKIEVTIVGGKIVYSSK